MIVMQSRDGKIVDREGREIGIPKLA